MLACYGFSAANMMRRLPFMRTTLSIFAIIFKVRGLIIVPALFSHRLNWRSLHDLFVIGSSAFIFAIGAAVAIGLISLQRQTIMAKST
jgi:hypothetical protein